MVCSLFPHIRLVFGGHCCSFDLQVFPTSSISIVGGMCDENIKFSLKIKAEKVDSKLLSVKDKVDDCDVNFFCEYLIAVGREDCFCEVFCSKAVVCIHPCDEAIIHIVWPI